jgi:cytochrome P450
VAVDPREGSGFLLNDSQMLDNPIPDLAYFRDHRPPFFKPDLLDGAIKETLRMEPPVTLVPRIALEDVELRGETIRAGQIVQLRIASANRDATRFPDPDRFDIALQPTRILSFGHGTHGCLGAHLAREQTKIAVETLFRRMSNLRIDESQEIRWYRNAGNRGPDALPLLF